MRCPNCNEENIAGADLCENCGSDLAGLDLPEAEAGFRGRLLTDKLRDLPLAPPLAATPETTAAEAIAIMRQARHGCVLIRENAELIGIFTERDVLTRIVRAGRDPRTTTMAQVMTAEPSVLQASDPPAFAIHLSVARGLRHIPVIEGADLLGLISVRHLLRHIHEMVLSAE